MVKKVIFYDGGCANCQKVAAFFSANGIDFERKNVKAHPELAKELKGKGTQTLPAVFVDGNLVTGWDEAKLRQLLGLS